MKTNKPTTNRTTLADGNQRIVINRITPEETYYNDFCWDIEHKGIGYSGALWFETTKDFISFVDMLNSFIEDRELRK